MAPRRNGLVEPNLRFVKTPPEVPPPTEGTGQGGRIPLNRASDYRDLETYVDAQADRLGVRTVSVDPTWLNDYIERQSYADWVHSQNEIDAIKFGEFITGLGADDLTL